MRGFYWIASYPKSGNTWLRLALADLMCPANSLKSRNGTSFAPNACWRAHVDEALDIETADLTAAESEALLPAAHHAMAAQSPRPLYRKVHDAWTLSAAGEPLFPPEVTLGTLYLVRDPRDVAVSWAHHSRLTPDDAIDFLCNPAAVLAWESARLNSLLPQRLLCWSGHARSWLNAPGRPPCLIRYEDMVADPIRTLRLAADHIGLHHDADAIERAVATTRFDALQAREAEQGFSGGQRAGAVFFRKGRAGGWREDLNGAQAARIERAHGEMMARFGYR